MKNYQTLSKVPPHLSSKRFTPPYWKRESFLHFVLIHPLASKVFLYYVYYTPTFYKLSYVSGSFSFRCRCFRQKTLLFGQYITIGAKHPTLLFLFAITLTISLPGFVTINIRSSLS
jgi:hypothetical protein